MADLQSGMPGEWRKQALSGYCNYIRRLLVAEAEQAHVATLAAIAAANHDATACDKPPIKLYKASAA